MRDKVLCHAGSLLGGFVHNLNTPLMWVMGRTQLMEARNEQLAAPAALDAEKVTAIHEKNAKDIASIAEGAEKIDQILKSIGYKIQMATEGLASLELRDYLRMETAFMLGDMRFKHETKREYFFENAPSFYVKIDYNALSWAFIETLNTIMDATGRGRQLRIGLEKGAIVISSPDMALTEPARARISAGAAGLAGAADILMDSDAGATVRIVMREG